MAKSLFKHYERKRERIQYIPLLDREEKCESQVNQYPGNNQNCSSPSCRPIKYMSGCYVTNIFITRTSDRLEVFPFFPFFPLSALRPLCVAWPTYAKISMSRQNRVYYKRSVTWQMAACLSAHLSPPTSKFVRLLAGTAI